MCTLFRSLIAIVMVTAISAPVLAINGDINADGTVNWPDVGIMSDQWLGTGSADLNGRGKVDSFDFALLSANWLNTDPLPPPGAASNPSPVNGAVAEDTAANLLWDAGTNAASHYVYFGTAASPPFIRNQTAASYQPPALSYNTVYYWRINEENSAGTAAGAVWSFKTRVNGSVTAPVADLFAVPTQGWDLYCQPEFVSASTGWITNYLWEFGDGSHSTELAPHHKYAGPGIYTIKLTVSGPGGASSITKTSYITIKDFETEYNYPDYVLASPTQAEFDAALDAIEATQVPYGTPPPWCGPNWCSLTQYGGGGRILFGFSDTTIETNWDNRIDSRNPTGNSDYKRDFFGDNLIIDGQDKHITFHYNGISDCGQAENRGCMRIHGNDNIVRNIAWERFPDGLHMRGGERNLIEGLTTMIVCEDATTMGGSSNSCRSCVLRDAVYGPSADKTFMINTADESLIVIDNMHSTNGNQPIRISNGESPMLLVVRNSLFEGDSQGPRFGTPKATVIFENNLCTGGMDNGIRLGEGISGIIRHNIFENCAFYGIFTYNDSKGCNIRVENNIIRNNGGTGGNPSYGGILIDAYMNVDLGGGLVDVYTSSGMHYGSGTVPVPSVGQNTITGNIEYDVIRTPTNPVVKAENNFWDHTAVADVIANDISGDVDVSPLGRDPSSGLLPIVTVTATVPNAYEGGTAGQFTVSRDAADAAAMTIGYTISGTAANTTDYATLTGSVTIPANQLSATIAVTAVDDTADEGAETVIIALNSGTGYEVGSGPATVTIIDNDWADPGWTGLARDSFESGWGNYTSGGAYAVVDCATGHATDGSCVAHIDKGGSTGADLAGSFALTAGMDLTSYKQLKVKFDFFVSTDLGNAEGFMVEYYDGTAWHVLRNYVKGTNFTVGTQYTNVELYAFKGQYTFPSAAKIRFQSVGNSNTDDIYIDNVKVMANVNASASEVELFLDDFDRGGNITDTGEWTIMDTNTKLEGAAKHGSAGSGISIKYNSWAQSIQPSSGFQNIHLKYWRKTISFEPADNDKYYTEWSVDGTAWNTLETVTSTLDWTYVDNTCASGANNNSNYRVRLRMAGSATNDYIYIDDVKITGYQIP